MGSAGRAAAGRVGEEVGRWGGPARLQAGVVGKGENIIFI